MHSQHAQLGRKPICYQLGGSSIQSGGAIRSSGMKPIKLQRIFAEIGVKNQMIAERILNKKGEPLSRSTISSALNRGIIPKANTPDFEAQIEAYLRELGVSKKTIKTCWDNESKDNVVSFGKGVAKKGKGMLQSVSKKTTDDEILKEAEVLTPTTLRLFKMFRNPFIDDVQKTEDVFMGVSHSYALAAMMDAARNGGMCALIGECGAGKSVLRRKLTHDLQLEGDVRIIFPQTIDKQYLTSNQILEAIVNDLSPGEKVRRTNEAKARQVRDLLLSSAQAGMRHVLVLEEAHDLSVSTMKQLKRLWEIEDGYRKVLGIVLIAQPELKTRLNIQNHPEMREMIMRCSKSELLPLTDGLEDYVAMKFKRVGLELSQVFEDDWADALRERLTSSNGQEYTSRLYPLYIHHVLSSAMNDAAEMGEPLVSADTILGA